MQGSPSPCSHRPPHWQDSQLPLQKRPQPPVSSQPPCPSPTSITPPRPHQALQLWCPVTEIPWTARPASARRHLAHIPPTHLSGSVSCWVRILTLAREAESPSPHARPQSHPQATVCPSPQGETAPDLGWTSAGGRQRTPGTAPMHTPAGMETWDLGTNVKGAPKPLVNHPQREI